MQATRTLIRQLQARLEGKDRREGSVNVTWPGGSTSSDIMTVSHGFGEVPKVWVQSQDQSGVGPNSAYVVDVGALTFRVRVVTPSFTPTSGAVTPVAFEAWL